MTLIDSILNLLKKYQNEPLNGYFIAKITHHIEAKPSGIVWKAGMRDCRVAIITDFIIIRKGIEIILLKPKSQPALMPSQIPQIIKPGQVCVFDNDELRFYLENSEDKNPIHFGEKPIIPGLMILKYLFEIIEFHSGFSIRFYNPLFVNNELVISQTTDNQIVGINNDNLIFKMNFSKN